MADQEGAGSKAWLTPAVLVAIAGLIFGIYQFRQTHRNDNETVSVSLSPSSARSALFTQVVFVDASGLQDGERVRIFWNGSDIGDTVCSAGIATDDINVPNSIRPGTYVVEVKGLSSGRYGTASFVVSS